MWFIFIVSTRLRDFIALPLLHPKPNRSTSCSVHPLPHFSLHLTLHAEALANSRNSTSFPSSHSPFPPGKRKPLTPPQDPSPQNKSRTTTNPTMQPTAPRIPILLKAHLPKLNHRVVRPEPASEEQPADHLASTHTQSEGARGVGC
jgi:hypothetical protein